MAVVQAIINKRFLYRGNQEVYSNVYHLSGTRPANDAAWHAVLDALKNAELGVTNAACTWIDGYGYNDGHWEDKPQTVDSHQTWASANTGTLVTTGGTLCQGDSAVWVRWSTGDRNSRGKPIYLRKYFHPAWSAGSPADNVLPAQITALGVYAAKMVDGTTIPGGLVLCRPNGDVGSSPFAGAYVTTRTLKRRGKRPNP